MDWKARLRGHAFDLDSLTDVFHQGDPVVGRDEQGHYIASSRFDGFTESLDVKGRAETLLRKVNGLGRLLVSEFEPVELSGTFSTRDGQTTHVLAVDSATVRSRASVGVVVAGDDRPPHPPPPAGPKYLALAATDRNVADAVRFLGSPSEPDWFLLWKIFEIIQHDVGGRAAISKAGWASSGDLHAFGASANLETVSGDEARHARKATGRPPPRTMTLREATRLVYDLAQAWIDAKLAQTG